MVSYHNSVQLLLIAAESGRCFLDENSLTFMSNPNRSHLQRPMFRSSTYTLATESNQNQTTISP